MTARTGKSLKRWLVRVAAAGLLLIAWSFLSGEMKPDAIIIQFIGLTNFPGQRQPTALFGISNLAENALNIGHWVEVKTAGWPVYGPDMQAQGHSDPPLPPRQSVTLTIPVPDYGSAWRVRVVYSEGFTKWDTTRSSWAAFLHARKLHSAARLLWRGKQVREILIPEMKI